MNVKRPRKIGWRQHLTDALTVLAIFGLMCAGMFLGGN